MKDREKDWLYSCKRIVSPKYTLFVICILTVFLTICGCIDQKSITPAGGSGGITILVDDPDQVQGVQGLAAMYQNQTGKKVVVKEVTTDNNIEPNLLSGDLLVSDMSRIPLYADSRILSPLNPHLDSGIILNWTSFERPTLVMAGEFPARSGTIYALPFDSDALGVAYRTDLFNDPTIAASFCSTQGYPVGIPGTYDELNTLASFFSRNASDISGIGFSGVEGPNPRSSPWLSVVSSYGGGVVNPSQGTVSGTWNSSNTRSALIMLRNLTASEPEGAEKWGDRDVIDAFGSGKLAMAITWFSRFPGLISATEKQNLSVGFFPLPGQVTDGESHRGVTIKLDGIGIIANASSEQSLAFLSWFYSPAVQLVWAGSGHQPSLIPVLDSNGYLSMTPYNLAFPESLRIGVTELKGRNAPEVRQICEETVRDALLASGLNQNEVNISLLDDSAGKINRLILQ